MHYTLYSEQAKRLFIPGTVVPWTSPFPERHTLLLFKFLKGALLLPLPIGCFSQEERKQLAELKISRPQGVCCLCNPKAEISTFSGSAREFTGSCLCSRPARAGLHYTFMTSCLSICASSLLLLSFLFSFVLPSFFLSFLSFFPLIDTIPQLLKIQPNHWFSKKRNCRNNLSGFVAMTSRQSPLGHLSGTSCRSTFIHAITTWCPLHLHL